MNAALKDTYVKTILFGKDIVTNVSVDRLVNIDLNNKTLTGNIAFTTQQPGNITLGKGTVKGNLLVDTPNVSFTNEATVEGATTIKDVANNTFTNNGSLKTVLLQDNNETRFVNGVSGIIVNDLVIDTTSNVKLQGQFNSVILKKSANLELKQNTSINTLTAQENVNSVVIGGVVENHSGSVEVKNPKVTIKDYVTYKVTKDKNDYFGVQARITLPETERDLLGEDDQVVVYLMKGDTILSTSTTNGKGQLLKGYFMNEFDNEKYYASTLFVPNGSYPSKGWTTTDWKATEADKPDGLKVEIKRGDKIVSSTSSTLALNEKFVDGSSKEALAWETIFDINSPE